MIINFKSNNICNKICQAEEINCAFNFCKYKISFRNAEIIKKTGGILYIIENQNNQYYSYDGWTWNHMESISFDNIDIGNLYMSRLPDSSKLSLVEHLFQ